jgi:hypothetical protein
MTVINSQQFTSSLHQKARPDPLPFACSLQGETPAPKLAYALAAVKGHIYVHGGMGPDRHYTNDLHVLDLARLGWRLLKQGPPGSARPSPRSGHSLTHVAARLYLFGGA